MDKSRLAERVELDAPAHDAALAECGARFSIEWTIYPRNPWIIRDLTTGRAVPQNEKGIFAHFASPEAAERALIKLQNGARNA